MKDWRGILPWNKTTAWQPLNVLRRADRALYRAKSCGSDQIAEARHGLHN